MYRENRAYANRPIKRLHYGMYGCGYQYDPNAIGEIPAPDKEDIPLSIDGFNLTTYESDSDSELDGEGLMDIPKSAVKGTFKLAKTGVKTALKPVKIVAKEGLKLVAKEAASQAKDAFTGALKNAMSTSGNGDLEGGFIFSISALIASAVVAAKAAGATAIAAGSAVAVAAKTAGVAGIAVGAAKAAGVGAAGAIGRQVIKSVAGDGMCGDGIFDVVEDASKLIMKLPIKTILRKVSKEGKKELLNIAKKLQVKGKSAVEGIATKTLSILNPAIMKAVEEKKSLEGNGLTDEDFEGDGVFEDALGFVKGKVDKVGKEVAKKVVRFTTGKGLKRSGEGLRRAGNGLKRSGEGLVQAGFGLKQAGVGEKLKEEMMKKYS